MGLPPQPDVIAPQGGDVGLGREPPPPPRDPPSNPTLPPPLLPTDPRLRETGNGNRRGPPATTPPPRSGHQGPTCWECGRRGHFSAQCWDRKARERWEGKGGGKGKGLGKGQGWPPSARYAPYPIGGISQYHPTPPTMPATTEKHIHIHLSWYCACSIVLVSCCM